MVKRQDDRPAELRSAFDAFWAAYPPRRPNPRVLAETAFAAAVRGGTAPEALIGAAGAYAAEVKAKGIAEAFIVHARTFLVQQRFRDYLVPATPEPVVSNNLVEPDHPWWPSFKGRCSPGEFRVWIAPLKLCGTIPDPMSIGVLEAPSRFHRDTVRERFSEPLKAALAVRQLMLRAPGDPVR